MTELPILHNTVLICLPQTVTGFQKSQVLPEGWREGSSPSVGKSAQSVESSLGSADDIEPLLLMENGRYLPIFHKLEQTLHTVITQGQTVGTQLKLI